MSLRPSPGPAAPRLPDDLVRYGILPRLPVRSLARFATVCKAWRDLILRDAAFAALQAESPSRASAALARFHGGRLEVLAPGGGAADGSLALPDPSLSFLTAGGAYWRLELCAYTGGLLCLRAVRSESRRFVFCVCNPATGSFHLISHDYCPLGVAGLAYDPAAAAARGYDVVVAVAEGVQACRFYRFSSRAAGSGWRAAPNVASLAPYEALQPKPAYAGGRVHWLTNRGNVVWHDVESELTGTLPPPPRASGGGRIAGNMDLAGWRGRLRLACASRAGLGVWELASYGGAGAPAQWDAVHWRRWRAIPGVVAPERCFMWSVVPGGMLAGGEEALGLSLRCAHAPAPPADGEAAAAGRREDVWCRALVRYESCTGATAATVELGGKQVHDGLGTVFGYHSSLAALPTLKWDA
jgi:hypothetical protein